MGGICVHLAFLYWDIQQWLLVDDLPPMSTDFTVFLFLYFYSYFYSLASLFCLVCFCGTSIEDYVGKSRTGELVLLLFPFFSLFPALRDFG
jgi:hypothetical protein